MEEEKSCIYVPLWFIAMGFLVLSFIGCSHTANTLDCEDEPFVHTCPEQGHGACPICFDVVLQNEEVVVLD